MKVGYINIYMFSKRCPYAIKDEDTNQVKNGDIDFDDIANFCLANGLEKVYLYGKKEFTKGIKKNINKYFSKCNIILAEK